MWSAACAGPLGSMAHLQGEVCAVVPCSARPESVPRARFWTRGHCSRGRLVGGVGSMEHSQGEFCPVVPVSARPGTVLCRSLRCAVCHSCDVFVECRWALCSTEEFGGRSTLRVSRNCRFCTGHLPKAHPNEFNGSFFLGTSPDARHKVVDRLA